MSDKVKTLSTHWFGADDDDDDDDSDNNDTVWLSYLLLL